MMHFVSFSRLGDVIFGAGLVFVGLLALTALALPIAVILMTLPSGDVINLSYCKALGLAMLIVLSAYLFLFNNMENGYQIYAVSWGVSVIFCALSWIMHFLM